MSAIKQTSDQIVRLLEAVQATVDDVIVGRQEALARITELVESEEKAWQTVAKLRVELETTDRWRLRVKELEEAARKVCDTPPGDWELTCNGEAFNELDALLTDQVKDTP